MSFGSPGATESRSARAELRERAPRLSSEYPWFADQGDGTYRNPLLWADYPDPDVIRHGDDYYMVVSSFQCTPGLPILHSRDLVNWTIINHAVQNLPHPRFDAVQPGCGIWAPAIRRHADRFWIFFGMPDEGIYCTTASDPAGTWSPPHLVQEGKGLIDPCPFWDDDGNAYLVHAYAGSRAGIKHKLRVRPMAPDGSRLLGEGQIIFDDPQNQPTLEGPKFLKRNGYYYILAPAGGVEEGWQLALRSRHIYGPYEEKVVLERGSTSINGPHQGALVDTASGEWWFVHFQDAKPYGRVPHLQPARWEDDWPLIGIDYDGNGIGEPVTGHAKPGSPAAAMPPQPIIVPATSDDFGSGELGLQWHWNANHKSSWYTLKARPGWIRLSPQGIGPGATPPNGPDQFNLIEAPSVLLQKFPARAFSAETRLELGEGTEYHHAGLAVLGKAYAALDVRAEPGQDRLRLACIVDGATRATAWIPRAAVILRVQVADGGACTFSYEIAGKPAVILPAQFTAVEGAWVGAKIGIYAVDTAPHSPTRTSAQDGSIYADFDYLRFSSAGSDSQVRHGGGCSHDILQLSEWV
jgi:hypothetical protein